MSEIGANNIDLDAIEIEIERIQSKYPHLKKLKG